MIRVLTFEYRQLDNSVAAEGLETFSRTQVTASLGRAFRVPGHIAIPRIDLEVHLSPGLKSGSFAGGASGNSSASNDPSGELVKHRGDDRVDFGLRRGKRLTTSLADIPADPAPLRLFHSTNLLQKSTTRRFFTPLFSNLFPKRTSVNVIRQRAAVSLK
jgi:hypothetical protein